MCWSTSFQLIFASRLDMYGSEYIRSIKIHKRYMNKAGRIKKLYMEKENVDQ